jgi:hypothetical protein
VVDVDLPVDIRAEIDRRVATVERIRVREVEFRRPGLHGAGGRRPMGAVLTELIDDQPAGGAVMFVAPNERLFSNHVRLLANALVQDPELASAASATILQYGESPVHGIHDIIDFSQTVPTQPVGFARFILRTAAIDPDFRLALPYVDRKVFAVLTGSNPPRQLIPSTVVLDALTEFPSGAWSEAQENAVIADFCPESLRRQTGFIAALPHIHVPQVRVRLLARIARKLVNRRWLAGQLRAIRKRGLAARLQVLRRKLTS